MQPRAPIATIAIGGIVYRNFGGAHAWRASTSNLLSNRFRQSPAVS